MRARPTLATAAAAAAEKAEASSTIEPKQTSGGAETLDREAIMTPATRHTKEARRSGPEAERSEDPSTRTRLLAYGKDSLPILRQQSAAASGDVRRAQPFGATHTGRRSPDLRVLQLPAQPQRARRLADSAHGVVGELTPTSRQWGATPFGSALNFASAIWLPLLHCMLAFRGWCCMRWRYLLLSCFCGVRPIVIGLPAMQQHSCARGHKRHYLTCIVARIIWSDRLGVVQNSFRIGVIA